MIQPKPLSEQITPLSQRQVEEEEEILQTKDISSQTPELTPGFESRIHSLRGGGQPLPESVRAFFEPRFGQDFSRVRIHNNLETAKMARSLNAQAFTLGKNIVFGAGQYAPETTAGKKLLAHELAHTVQQTGQVSGASNKLQRAVNFKADFTNPLLTQGSEAIITDDLFDSQNASFYADAEIVAIGDSIAALNQWDVGILQDMTTNWDRYYWRRANIDGRGRFVEQKYKPVRSRFRDQVLKTKTVWVYDDAHQLLSALKPVEMKDRRFQVSTTIEFCDHPHSGGTVSGSSLPGTDASDGTRNIDIVRSGGRFNTWISALNNVSGEWRHLCRLNWNYQKSLNFKGR